MHSIAERDRMSRADLEARIEELEKYIEDLEDSVSTEFSNVYENMQAVHDHNVDSLNYVVDDFRKHNLVLVVLVVVVIMNLVMFVK